jgi:uncharacterized protein YdeI (BOF family)
MRIQSMSLIAASVLALSFSGGLNALADSGSDAAGTTIQKSETTTTQTKQTSGNMPSTSITAQSINQNASTYVGKQVALTGKIDRVIGPGAFVVSDTDSDKPEHRILILTSGTGMSNAKTKDQAGIAGTTLREGDKVTLSGKVEQLNVDTATDTFSPRSDQETLQETAASMPVVIVQPGSLHMPS